MPDRTRPSPTAAGVLRRRATRLVELGLLVAVTADSEERPRVYTVVTSGGDVVDVARRDLPAYFSGIAHGAQAAGSLGERAVRQGREALEARR